MTGNIYVKDFAITHNGDLLKKKKTGITYRLIDNIHFSHNLFKWKYVSVIKSLNYV